MKMPTKSKNTMVAIWRKGLFLKVYFKLSFKEIFSWHLAGCRLTAKDRRHKADNYYQYADQYSYNANTLNFIFARMRRDSHHNVPSPRPPSAVINVRYAMILVRSL